MVSVDTKLRFGTEKQSDATLKPGSGENYGDVENGTISEKTKGYTLGPIVKHTPYFSGIFKDIVYK
jgi:hypothetical protein